MSFHSALPISLSQLSFFDDVDQPLDSLDNPRLMGPSSPLSSATWDDLSYFSEPEFDSDYRYTHKANKVLIYNETKTKALIIPAWRANISLAIKNRTTKAMGLTNGRQASLSSSAPTHGSSLIQPPNLIQVTDVSLLAYRSHREFNWPPMAINKTCGPYISRAQDVASFFLIYREEVPYTGPFLFQRNRRRRRPESIATLCHLVSFLLHVLSRPISGALGPIKYSINWNATLFLKSKSQVSAI